MILATFVRRRSGLAWLRLSLYSVKCSRKQMEGGLTGVLRYGRKGEGVISFPFQLSDFE
jgi:hypothetical protein